MAGTGSKTTSGISTSTTLYGWDSIYSPTSYVVQGKSGQSVIYGSPYWYEKIFGSGNDAIYAGGFFSSTGYSLGSGKNSITVNPYQASAIDGGTGSNWIVFSNFTSLSTVPTGYAQRLSDAPSTPPSTAGNNFLDLGGGVTDAEDPRFLPTSLISGNGNAVDVYGTPGVIVNLSNKTLSSALAPFIRLSGQANNFGLSSGISDYLTARLLSSEAINGLNGTTSLYAAQGGLGPGQYAFAGGESGSAKYAVGQVSNIQNVRGSNDASNLIVAGASSGILQGGAKCVFR